MKITPHPIPIRDLVHNFSDDGALGVFGCNGLLVIRPSYQREYVYSDVQAAKVIRSILEDKPINVFYWSRSPNGFYELVDGQQRTLSICYFIQGKFFYNSMLWGSLTEEERQKILDYELQVYVCEGTEREKLDWFETINTTTEPLTEQELRNAVYTGSWLTSAKLSFSSGNTGSLAALPENARYIAGVPNRQGKLETVLKWITDGTDEGIRNYMGAHQHDQDARELETFVKRVISWANITFPNYRREMLGLPWGELYKAHGKTEYDPVAIEDEIRALLEDDDVTKKSGVYAYVLDHNTSHLNIRAFSVSQKRQAFELQEGVCPHCEREGRSVVRHEFDEMEGDHIVPWSQGGRTSVDNLQMLCRDHNRKKGKQ